MRSALDLPVSTLATVLGLFVASSPARAARIWGSEHLESLAPQSRTWFLRLYRVFGITLSVGGALFALETIGVWKY